MSDVSRAETPDLAEAIPKLSVWSIERKLARLKMNPKLDEAETRLAITASKIHDANFGHGLMTSVIALAALALSLNSVVGTPIWAAFAVALVGAFILWGMLLDKQYWEVVKAVLEHRIAAKNSLDDSKSD